MRLATVRTTVGSRGAVVDDGSVQLLDFDDAGGVIRALAQGEVLHSLPRLGEIELESAVFAPPVADPDKIICVGLNFHSHAAETNLSVGDHPMLFAKYTGALIGAGDDIAMPPESEKCDWEAELAVVIGQPARRVPVADALEVIAGYTVVNDITMRDWQRHTSQFMAGKTFEGSTPIGPWIVRLEDVDHADVRLRCLVNGETRQDCSTSDMIFSVPEVIAYVSTMITLLPGDVISMGTPAGVGSARRPQLFLQPGDVVTTEVEGIGVLTNRCVEEALVGALA